MSTPVRAAVPGAVVPEAPSAGASPGKDQRDDVLPDDVLPDDVLPDDVLPDDVLTGIVAAAYDLDERVAGRVVPGPVVPGRDDGRTDELLDTWRRLHHGLGLVDLDRRLAADGLTVDAVRPLLGPVTTVPGAPLPEWAEVLRACVRATSREEDVVVPEGRRSRPFAELLAPSVAVADRRLAARVGDRYDRLSPRALLGAHGALLDVLVEVTSWTLAAGFHAFRAAREDALFRVVRRESGRSASRLHEGYLRHLRSGGLVRLLRDHPVLGRYWADAVLTWVDALAELLERLEADEQVLEERLGAGRPGAPVADLRLGLSDRHHGGRTVALLRLAGGRRVVHKPRGLGLEREYNELLRWAGAQGAPVPLRPLEVVDRGTYGWVEAVEARDCADATEVREYYRRAGALLCVVHVLEGADCHVENVVAAGPDPVLVDAEALLHLRATVTHQGRGTGAPGAPGAPGEGGQGRTAADDAELAAGEDHRSSVYSTGLLPHWTVDRDGTPVDVSGLGGYGEQATTRWVLRWDDVGTDEMRLATASAVVSRPVNVPTLGGVPQPMTGYEADVVGGFAATYVFLRRHRAALAAPGGAVDRLARQPSRVIVRDSDVYGDLRHLLVQPGALVDGVTQSLVLEPLVAAALVAGDPTRCRRLVREESASLRRYDVPHLRARGDSTTLDLPDGSALPGVAARPAADAVREKLAGLGSEDLRHQVAVVRATFATRALLTAHTEPEPRPGAAAVPAGDGQGSTAGPVGDDLLLTGARRIGELLARTAVVRQGDATWMGLDYDDRMGRYTYRPVGSDLYSGRTGTALFLAALWAVTRDDAWRRLASAAVARARRPGQGPAVADAGALYALVHVAGLLGDEVLLADALRRGRALDDAAVGEDAVYDVLFGSAGAVLALLALHGATGDDVVLDRATACGRHLLARRSPTPAGPRAWAARGAPALAGFSHGSAGVAHALLRLADVVGEPAFRDAGLEALEAERALFDPQARNWRDLRPGTAQPGGYMTAWCNGATGIGLSRLALRHLVADDVVPREVDAAVHSTRLLRHDPLDQVCCGGFGRVGLLLAAGRELDRPDLVTEARAWAAERVVRAHRSGGYHVVRPLPRSVQNPGFFQGVAGVGYQLLRLVAPERLPDVLVLA